MWRSKPRFCKLYEADRRYPQRESLKTIGAKAFSGCGKLKTIKIRSISLKKVGKMHSKAFRKKRSSNYRSIRIDVYAIDSEGNVYDAEMQGKNTGNLPRRSRLYESYINVSLLEAGETDFNKLNDNDVYVIIIAPVDLWGQGKYRYTFRMSCEGRGERRRKRRGQKRRAGKHRTGAKACRGKKTAPNRRKRSWSV